MVWESGAVRYIDGRVKECFYSGREGLDYSFSSLGGSGLALQWLGREWIIPSVVGEGVDYSFSD